MSFNTLADAALAAWFASDFADSITYAGNGIYGHIEYGQSPLRESDGQHTTATLIIKKSDVAAPAYRDQIVIDGATWRMQRVLVSDTWTWHLEIIRDERPAPFTRS